MIDAEPTSTTAAGPAPAGDPRPAPGDLSPARARALLGLILLAGALARLALWAALAGEPPRIWDERDYDSLATTIARHGEFAFEPGRPISIRPPLYPAVVAAVYKLAGVGNFQVVRLFQIALGLTIPVTLYGLGASLYCRRVGTWAAGLGALYPSLAAYGNLLLTETQFTALLCGTCLAGVLAYRRRSVPLLAATGVLIGLAALTRSAMWPFPAVLAVFLLATWPGGMRQRIAAAAAVALAATATMAPWAVRNMRLERTFMTVDSMGGRNLMMGNYEHTPMFRAWDAISVEGPRAWYAVLAEADPDSLGVTQGRKDKRAMRYAARYIAEHPWLTVRRDAVKFFNFWGLERELIAGASRGHFGALSRPAVLGIALMVVGSYAAAMLSGILGAVAAPPADRRGHALLLLVIAFLTGIHTLTFGHSRYHVPLMPLVLVYSAAAIVHAGSIWRGRGGWPARVASLLGAVLVLSWLLELAVIYRGDVAEIL